MLLGVRHVGRVQLNGPVHRWTIHIVRPVEEIVEVEAETEHEAAIAAGRGEVVYIYRHPEVEPDEETEPSH